MITHVQQTKQVQAMAKRFRSQGTNEEAEPEVQPAKRTKKDSAMRYLLGTLSYEDNMKTCSDKFYGRGDSNEYSNIRFFRKQSFEYLPICINSSR